MTDNEKKTGLPIDDEALDEVAGGVIPVEDFRHGGGKADETSCSPEEMMELHIEVLREVAFLNNVVYPRRDYEHY